MTSEPIYLNTYNSIYKVAFFTYSGVKFLYKGDIIFDAIKWYYSCGLSICRGDMQSELLELYLIENLPFIDNKISIA